MLVMKDNISTRIVLKRALQLGNRNPLDVRRCKARCLTCQVALYGNSEQQNAVLEANCHMDIQKIQKKKKRKGGLTKEVQWYNTNESPQPFREVKS